MKRYWLFAGDAYEAGGGMRDFKGCFDSEEEALAQPVGGDWMHVFDSQESVVVAWREHNETVRTVGRLRLEIWVAR